MDYYIKTDNSYLGKIAIDLEPLLLDCVQEIKGHLIVKPKIVMFGKEVSQQRNIGFFSDVSVGYHYSNKLAASKPLTPSLFRLMILSIIYYILILTAY